MKNSRINLHMEGKKKLLAIVSFLLLSVILCFVINLSLESVLSQLSILFKSDYDYSAYSDSSVGEDDYYIYNAGISFGLTQDDQTRLNASVVMQTKDSDYSDSVVWNSDKLEMNEIAVSKRMAKIHGLTIGDKLYSKHIVNGEITEYTIKNIIPEIQSLRFSQKSYDDGVIIMGYDERYYENISHRCIFFSSKSQQELPTNTKDIEYRKSEIIMAFKHILPYFLIYNILIISVTFGFVFYMRRGIRANFKRQIMIGFEKKSLDRAYNKHILLSGLISIVLICIMSLFIVFIIDFNIVSISLIIISLLLEMAVLIITSNYFNHRFWRM